MIGSKIDHNLSSPSTSKNIWRKFLIPFFQAILWVLLVTGCVLPGGTVELPPPAVDIVNTAVAETMTARGMIPGEVSVVFLPVIFANQQEGQGDSLSELYTPSPSPTITETPTDTPIPPTATPITPTLAPCLFAKFIQDINVPPGTVFVGGTKFTKIWRIQNTGSCTWNVNYTLIWVSGESLGAKDQVALPGTVSPGQMVDLMIDLAAPKNDGKYKGAWMINDSAGRVFGVGKNATDFLWVDIKVKNATTAVAKTATTKPNPIATTKPNPTATTAPPSTSVPTVTRTTTSTPTPTLTATTSTTTTVSLLSGWVR